MTYLTHRLLAVVVALTCCVGAAFAQETQNHAPGAVQAVVEAPDYVRWSERAVRVEETLAEGGASGTTLQAMRSQLADWREQFQHELDRKTARIGALETQLEALGPAPDEGMSESEEVAARRSELTTQLDELRAPAALAEEARARAAGLIDEIDAVLRARSLPDYELWARGATEAEAKLVNTTASDTVLETLRGDIATWREEFLAVQDANKTRLATLQAQLDTLGAPPEDGEEAPELAQRRAELTDQIAQLQAPALRADEAYTRADGIIGEIDSIIRTRQTDALLSVSASPLNPTYWSGAWQAFVGSFNAAGSELRINLASPIVQSEIKSNLPAILLLVVIGVTLIARGRRWAGQTVAHVRGTSKRSSGSFWSLVLSFGQVVLPLLGILAISMAGLVSGVAGTRWELILVALPVVAAMVLGLRWLADCCFHDNDALVILPIDPQDRPRARRYATWLAVILGLEAVLDLFAQLDRYTTETQAVLGFPLLVVAGIFLVQLGRVRSLPPTSDDTDEAHPSTFRQNLATLIGRAAIGLGALGPVMAAIGYTRLGEGMVYPTILTMGLIGAVLVLQRGLSKLYVAFAGEAANEQDSLLPVLGGGVLTVLALPPLALIWGARVSDLTEVWARFREGFQLGETRISPTDFLLVIVVFTVGYMLTRMIQGALRSSVLPKTGIEPGSQNAIVSGVGYVGIFLAAVVAITTGGLDLSSLAIVAGALSVGIGFGLQNIVSNFVSGIILLIERPISEGDWIEVNGTHGTVKNISVRSTRIETFDRFDVIIPNSDLVSGRVSNYTHGNVLGRLIVSVGVAYGNDTRKIESILLDIARQHPLVLMNPAPYVYFKGVGADSLDFEIRAILSNVNNSLGARTEINHQIVERFAAEGIEIPFAQRDIWIRNPEALSGKATAQQSAAGSLKPGQGTALGREEDGDADGESGGEAVGEAGGGEL
jgi:small-conductance mechanosensitive channel